MSTLQIEDDEDDDAFANSLDDIPEDIRSLTLNDSSDVSFRFFALFAIIICSFPFLFYFFFFLPILFLFCP